MNRRQFLIRSSIATLFSITPTLLWAKARPSLSIPPLLDVGRGRPIRLDFRPAQTQFEAVKKVVEVWGANGQYLAPTVKVKSDSFVKLTYTNNLPEVLSVHIQGLLASTEAIGSAHRQLEPKQSWSPIIQVQQPACTAWYYADTMFNRASQQARGIAGLWIIEDANSSADLPNQYGINDIPLILQDHLIQKEGEPLFKPNNVPFMGKRLFVNGVENPFMNLPRGWVRLRVVNASLSRRYHLRLDNEQPLQLIATGLGMLAHPVEMEEVPLAPNERVELLVDLSQGENVCLIDGSKQHFLDKIGQLFSQDHRLQDNVILEMRPQGLAPALHSVPTLPVRDNAQFHLKIAQERHFQLRPKDRLINQQRFDPKRIDVEAKLGTVERWYVRSTEAVGFTLQGAKFIIETRNKQAEPLSRLAWQDTVWLEEDQLVTLLVKFEQRATEQLPFTFGVSDVLLRDKGAIGQFIVK